MSAQSPSPSLGQTEPGASYESIEEVKAAFEPVMRAIATAVGPSCEVVLHDLSATSPDLEHTIAAIENGHVTGRHVGGPSTNLGVEVMRDQAADHDKFGYSGLTSDGRELNCSSIYLRNSSGRIIAALCINFDVSVVQRVQGLLGTLLPERTPAEEPSEFFGQDLVAVMKAMIDEAISEAGRPVEQMTREDRVAVLARLDQRGVLQMRKAVETVAGRLGISRVTAYAYLDEAHSAAAQS